jgi:hypothetical protein
MFIKYCATTALLVLCTLGIIIVSGEMVKYRDVQAHPPTIKSYHYHHPPFINDDEPAAQRV